MFVLQFVKNNNELSSMNLLNEDREIMNHGGILFIKSIIKSTGATHISDFSIELIETNSRTTINKLTEEHFGRSTTLPKQLSYIIHKFSSITIEEIPTEKDNIAQNDLFAKLIKTKLSGYVNKG